MTKLSNYLTRKLRLAVNQQKSAVDRPWNRQFLGYTVTNNKQPKLRVPSEHEKALKAKARLILRPGRGQAVRQTLEKLAPKIRGWASFYQLCDVKPAFVRFDEWLRRRIRAIFWRHWKRPGTRFRELTQRGLSRPHARKCAGNGRGPWWNAGASHMNRAIPAAAMRDLGWLSLLEEYQRLKKSAV